MGHIVIPIPVPARWLRATPKTGEVRAYLISKYVFRIQLIAILLLILSTSLLYAALFGEGEMREGRRNLFSNRSWCGRRSITFGFITSIIGLVYTLGTFTAQFPVLAFRSRRMNVIVTGLMSIVLLLAGIIPICLTRVENRYYSRAFDVVVLFGCSALLATSLLYAAVSVLVFSGIVADPQPHLSTPSKDDDEPLSPEEEGLLAGLA